ncbi:MAG: DUF6798 domain-containing protein [Microcoleaceae cyanobacterium]
MKQWSEFQQLSEQTSEFQVDLKQLWRGTIEILMMGAIFGISYVQRPLYTSNQNTKFLHGMAQAGLGYLDQDWLANTINPLPIFTGLVYLTRTFLFPGMFYVYYGILAGIYSYSLVGIVSKIFSFNTAIYNCIWYGVGSWGRTALPTPTPYQRAKRCNLTKKLIYFVLFIIIHCLEVTILGFKTHISLHYGVAEQYILGDCFQTSNFGALILLSIYWFVCGYNWYSILPLTIASTFHPTYLLIAALLTLAYMISLWRRESNLLKTIGIGGVSLILVLPVVLYSALVLQPTSPEISQQAQSLLVDRISHHTFPQEWWDSAALIQTLVVVLAIFLVRKTRLFLILLIPFGAAVCATVLQVMTQNHTLAFLTPWRVSAILVPLSTSIILGWLLNLRFIRFNSVSNLNQLQRQRLQKQKLQRQKLTIFICCMILSIYVWVGAGEQIRNLRRQPDYMPMMAFIYSQKSPEDLYLVPHTSGRFVEFRLQTGAPILSNYKSHPYKDVEVLEWHNRQMKAQRYYSPDFQTTHSQTQIENQQT